MPEVPLEVEGAGAAAAAASAPVALDVAPPSPYSLLCLGTVDDCNSPSSSCSGFCSLKDELSIEDGLGSSCEQALALARSTASTADPAAATCGQGGGGWARFQIAMFVLGWPCPPCWFIAAAAYPCVSRRDSTLASCEAIWWWRNCVMSLLFALEMLVLGVLLLCNALPLGASRQLEAAAEGLPEAAAPSPGFSVALPGPG